ncbi:MAG: flagellar export protein FliJ [Pseudomonadota bacterium]
MSSSKRLRPVVDHAESQENQQHQKLLQATAQLRAAEQQLAQLQDYRRSYTAGSASGDASALGSVGWRDRHVFLSRLNEAVSQQQARVGEHQQIVERERQRWVDCRVRAQSLQKVVDKREQRERAAELRREQAAVDETSARLAARRSAADADR